MELPFLEQSGLNPEVPHPFCGFSTSFSIGLAHKDSVAALQFTGQLVMFLMFNFRP